MKRGSGQGVSAANVIWDSAEVLVDDLDNIQATGFYGRLFAVALSKMVREFGADYTLEKVKQMAEFVMDIDDGKQPTRCAMESLPYSTMRHGHD